MTDDVLVQVWKTVDNGVALVMYGEDGIITLSMSVPCARDLARRIDERCDQVEVAMPAREVVE